MLAFVHVAKTGGQTIETMLANSFGAAFSAAPEWDSKNRTEVNEDGFVISKYRPEDLQKLLKACPWTKAVGGHPVTLWSGFDDIRPTTWFSMVREPIGRGASHYQYNLNEDTGRHREWDEWVDWPVHHNHQTKMFSPKADAADAIRRIQEKNVFVGLTERFDESLVILRKMVVPGLNISYKRTNTATDNSRAKNVLADPEKIDQIRSMYQEDFLLHEFISKEWYPQFQKAYGPTLEADVQQYRENREKEFNQWNYWMSRLNARLVLRTAIKFG